MKMDRFELDRQKLLLLLRWTNLSRGGGVAVAHPKWWALWLIHSLTPSSTALNGRINFMRCTREDWSLLLEVSHTYSDELFAKLLRIDFTIRRSCFIRLAADDEPREVIFTWAIIERGCMWVGGWEYRHPLWGASSAVGMKMRSTINWRIVRRGLIIAAAAAKRHPHSTVLLGYSMNME